MHCPLPTQQTAGQLFSACSFAVHPCCCTKQGVVKAAGSLEDSLGCVRLWAHEVRLWVAWLVSAVVMHVRCAPCSLGDVAVYCYSSPLMFCPSHTTSGCTSCTRCCACSTTAWWMMTTGCGWGGGWVSWWSHTSRRRSHASWVRARAACCDQAHVGCCCPSVRFCLHSVQLLCLCPLHLLA